VEVAGARLLAPHEVLAAGGIALGGSVWDDPSAWEARLRAHPVVAEAEVTRRLPRTLHVRVVEKRPAALAEVGALQPVTAAGEVLPVDPARVAVDLPLLRARVTAGPDRRLREGGARAALAQAGRLAELDPALAALVSEVRPERGGGVRLTLSRPAAEVLLPAEAPDAGRLRLLRAALDDVRRRQDAGAGPARVDLRFDDQVVVRLSHATPSANP
jgi:cell division protein FtsQ